MLSFGLLQYSVLLILIFAMEFSIGGSAYIYETQVDDELVHSMNETFVNNYGIDRRRTIAIDSMQQNVSKFRFFFLETSF